MTEVSKMAIRLTINAGVSGHDILKDSDSCQEAITTGI